jgi:Fe-S oxidoreductase
MPHLSKITLRSWYHAHIANQDIHSDRTVFVFCDEFTNFNDVEVGKKLILLLLKLGYNPIIPDHVESGRAFMSKAMIRNAQKIAIKNVQLLHAKISEKTPLIGVEPSAILSFRDEYPNLVPDELIIKSKEIGKNSFLFEEWFVREIEKGRISPDSFTKAHKELIVHGHCHQKALAGADSSIKALSFPANYKVSAIPSGCCGMAGSFGYELEHYDVSMKVGELVLFPSVRTADKDVIIAASGTSCRHQIKDGTGRQSYHPIEILFDALAK